MQQIDIDFEVWKALTHLRESEDQSYNHVLRNLLNLPAAGEIDVNSISVRNNAAGGRILGRRFLPNGTKLRADYKGAMYSAQIVDGNLLDNQGQRYNSASAAATAITNNNVNGLTFWEVKRPADSIWRKLSALPLIK